MEGIGLLKLAEETIDGDFDGDDDVDGEDFLVWQRGGAPGGVTQANLQLWRANFGTQSVAATGAVPEPGATLLASLAAWL